MTKPKPYHWYAMQYCEDLCKRNGCRASELVYVAPTYWCSVKTGSIPLTDSMAQKIILASNNQVAMSDLIEDHYPKEYSGVVRDKETWMIIESGKRKNEIEQEIIELRGGDNAD